MLSSRFSICLIPIEPAFSLASTNLKVEAPNGLVSCIYVGDVILSVCLDKISHNLKVLIQL